MQQEEIANLKQQNTISLVLFDDWDFTVGPTGNWKRLGMKDQHKFLEIPEYRVP